MKLKCREYLPQGHHRVDCVVTPGLQRVPGSHAVRIAIKVPWLCRLKARRNPWPFLFISSLSLILSALHNSSAMCLLTGFVIYPAVEFL